MTNHYSYLTVLYMLKTTFALHFQQVVRITLRSLRYDILVHTVGTDTHDAAQTTRTELQRTIESIDEIGLVFLLHQRLHFCTRLSVKRFASPYLCYRHHLF